MGHFLLIKNRWNAFCSSHPYDTVAMEGQNTHRAALPEGKRRATCKSFYTMLPCLRRRPISKRGRFFCFFCGHSHTHTQKNHYARSAFVFFSVSWGQKARLCPRLNKSDAAKTLTWGTRAHLWGIWNGQQPLHAMCVTLVCQQHGCRFAFGTRNVDVDNRKCFEMAASYSGRISPEPGDKTEMAIGLYKQVRTKKGFKKKSGSNSISRRRQSESKTSEPRGQTLFNAEVVLIPFNRLAFERTHHSLDAVGLALAFLKSSVWGGPACGVL